MNDIYEAYKAGREPEDHLEHHGIKGQKWGVRRFQNPDGTRIGAKKRKPKKEKEPERGPVHKKYKERFDTLDDDELKRRNARMIEEQKYRRMQDELYPDKRAQRRARFRKAISEAMTESIKEVTKATATAVGKRLMDSIFGTNMSGQGNKKKDKDKDNQNQNGQPGQHGKKGQKGQQSQQNQNSNQSSQQPTTSTSNTTAQSPTPWYKRRKNPLTRRRPGRIVINP